MLSSVGDKEVSIRELQFQENMEVLMKYKDKNPELMKKLESSARKPNIYKEVLVENSNSHIYRSLSKYNRRENLSVERLARTGSPFKKDRTSKPPMPTSKRRYTAKEKFRRSTRRSRPSYFNFGNN